jgi:putative transposase
MRTVAHRAFRYRFEPTPEQAALLTRTFGCVRYVWNWALAERQRAYVAEGRSVGYAETDRMLTALKGDAEHDWLREVPSVPLQQALRHLQGAYAAFFAKRARYPRFKRKRASRASATFTRNGFSWRNGELRLAKLTEPLAIRWSRPLPEKADPSSVTVVRDAAGRWFVSILVEDPTIRPLPRVETAVGIDAGLATLLTLSTGEKIANPRHERRDRIKLARAQRSLAKKRKGSANRAKARVRVARIHARIADRRRDHLHTLTTRFVRENQVLVIEDLTVRNMTRNHSLARAISDASWGEMRRMLEYKADWYGRTVVAVDRWYPSSRTCSTCGAIKATMPLSVREWACECGASHDRDVNAAKNILTAGLAAVMPAEAA